MLADVSMRDTSRFRRRKNAARAAFDPLDASSAARVRLPESGFGSSTRVSFAVGRPSIADAPRVREAAGFSAGDRDESESCAMRTSGLRPSQSYGPRRRTKLRAIPQSAVHGGGGTYVSLIFLRYSGYSVSR